MKQHVMAVFIVLALISVDLSISIVNAQTKIKIYQVTKVSPSGKLRLRAWPSSKSRIKVSLPYNAKDLVETGKQRDIGKSRWVQVKWQEHTGWVNSHYLEKTGVLLRPEKAIASRNNKAISKSHELALNTETSKAAVSNTISDITPNSDEHLPNEYQGDRYDQTLQPVQQVSDTSKMAYSAPKKKQESSGWVLNCAGNSPKSWKIKMDVAAKTMFVKLADSQEFNIPITYRKWAPGGQVRMEIGGGKGRNLVDATLEKTYACNNGLSKTNSYYRVNAAVNRGELLSGCCNPVAE